MAYEDYDTTSSIDFDSKVKRPMFEIVELLFYDRTQDMTQLEEQAMEEFIEQLKQDAEQTGE